MHNIAFLGQSNSEHSHRQLGFTVQLGGIFKRSNALMCIGRETNPSISHQNWAIPPTTALFSSGGGCRARSHDGHGHVHGILGQQYSHLTPNHPPSPGTTNIQHLSPPILHEQLVISSSLLGLPDELAFPHRNLLDLYSPYIS